MLEAKVYSHVKSFLEKINEQVFLILIEQILWYLLVFASSQIFIRRSFRSLLFKSLTTMNKSPFLFVPKHTERKWNQWSISNLLLSYLSWNWNYDILFDFEKINEAGNLLVCELLTANPIEHISTIIKRFINWRGLINKIF